MDPDKPSSSPRKVKFAPKSPPRRTTKPPAVPKPEVEDSSVADDESTQALLRRVNEHLGRREQKGEKKSSVQVAFAHGGSSSDSLRTYGNPRGANSGKSIYTSAKDGYVDDEQFHSSSVSTDKADETSESSVNAMDASHKKRKKDYREPWDYHHSYYPVSLPLRRPYSGDPELLDEAEFGAAAMNAEYDENTINSASVLGLLEENDGPQMLFFQFPDNLPLGKQSASASEKEMTDSLKSSAREGASTSAKGKETVGKSVSVGKRNISKAGSSLQDLTGGRIGKMLVYKSGAVKLKLGEFLYDVSPGVDIVCAQDVVAMNTVDKNCCVLGELHKRAVVTPDINSLLDSAIDLG